MADSIKTHKVCSACNESRPIEHFGLCTGYKDGRRGQCTTCRAAANRKYQRAPSQPRKAKPEQTRRSKLRLRYGLTESAFAEMLAAQGGGCAICGSHQAGGRYGVFHVDHCHDSGRVRGILCHLCNTTLGSLGDSLDAVNKFVRYLQA